MQRLQAAAEARVSKPRCTAAQAAGAPGWRLRRSGSGNTVDQASQWLCNCRNCLSRVHVCCVTLTHRCCTTMLSSQLCSPLSVWACPAVCRLRHFSHSTTSQWPPPPTTSTTTTAPHSHPTAPPLPAPAGRHRCGASGVWQVCRPHRPADGDGAGRPASAVAASSGPWAAASRGSGSSCRQQRRRAGHAAFLLPPWGDRGPVHSAGGLMNVGSVSVNLIACPVLVPDTCGSDSLNAVQSRRCSWFGTSKQLTWWLPSNRPQQST